MLLYKNDLKEVNIRTKTIKKVFENKTYDIQLSVGETFLGDVTSVSIEILDTETSKLYNVLLLNKKTISENIEKLISGISPSIGRGIPVNPVGNCLSTCNKTWNCYGQPTTAGTLLCASDCIIECSSK